MNENATLSHNPTRRNREAFQDNTGVMQVGTQNVSKSEPTLRCVPLDVFITLRNYCNEIVLLLFGAVTFFKLNFNRFPRKRLYSTY